MGRYEAIASKLSQERIIAIPGIIIKIPLKLGTMAQKRECESGATVLQWLDRCRPRNESGNQNRVYAIEPECYFVSQDLPSQSLYVGCRDNFPAVERCDTKIL